MSTAQILFEQYKVLPPRIRRELKELIDEEEVDKKTPLLEQIREGMQEIRLIRQGKVKPKPAREFLAEFRQDVANED
jgi:hypothetical protein